MAASVFVQQVIGSETITLLVGSEREEWPVPKALISKTSSLLACEIEKSANNPAPHTGVINLEEDPRPAVETFVQWCFQERLQPLDPKSNGNARKALKGKLIELWIFSSNYAIPKLQNEAMQLLLETVLVPHLITKADVHYVWECSDDTNNALKWFITCALVAQMEEGTGTQITKIGELDEFRNGPGFMIMLYKALRLWNATAFPKTPKKGRTRWTVFAASEDVKRHIMVSEKKKPIQKTAVEEPVAAEEPTNGEKTTGEKMIIEKPVVVKREMPDDFEDSPSKKGPGATMEDAIMLDDD